MIFIGEHPESAIAVLDAEGRVWSYGQLRTEVGRRMEQLRGPKSLVFLFCRNTLSSLTWYLAAVSGGHAVALLDQKLVPEWKQRLVDRYQPEYIVSEERVAEEDHPEEENLWRSRGGNAELHPDLSVLLSTSGSTGSPKFVRLTRANLEANALSISEALEIQASDRAVASLPMQYSYGLSVINTHLLRGASLFLTEAGITSTDLWQNVRTLGCTSFAGVPYTYQVLERLNLDKLNVPNLHTFTQAGGKLNAHLVEKFAQKAAQRNGRFFVMYGQTEATARIAILPAPEVFSKPTSAGKAIPRGRFAILSGEQETRQPGVEGELIYYGPNVMMGYAESREDLGRGDERKQRLETGDVACLDDAGYLYLTGRSKRDVKLMGLRINLDEVEDWVRRYAPAAAVGAGESIHVFLEHNGPETEREEWRREVAAKLHVHFRAIVFHALSQLPVHSSGKIDYGTLTAQVRGQA